MRTFLHRLSLAVTISLLPVACSDHGFLPVQTTLAPDTVYIMRDAEYRDERIFDLFLPGQASPQDRVAKLILYHEDDITRNPTAWTCSLYVDPSQPGTYANRTLTHEMAPYTAEHFTYYNEASCGRHFVVFAESHPQNSALAAFIVVDRYDQSNVFLRTDTIGDLTPTVPHLKMLSAGQDMEPSHPVWPLTWRNCYRIPKGVAPGDIELQVRQATPGREDSTAFDFRQLSPDSLDEGAFITILGLDQFDRTGLKIPDGLLDGHDAVFRPEWELIIFPSRQPFDSDTTFVDAGGARTAALRLRVPGLYDYPSMNDRFLSSQYYLLMRVVNQ